MRPSQRIKPQFFSFEPQLNISNFGDSKNTWLSFRHFFQTWEQLQTNVVFFHCWSWSCYSCVLCYVMVFWYFPLTIMTVNCLFRQRTWIHWSAESKAMAAELMGKYHQSWHITSSLLLNTLDGRRMKIFPSLDKTSQTVAMRSLKIVLKIFGDI